jgi:SAM-dependent methyltransferase
MDDYERKYYEAEQFWKDNMVQDSINMLRIKATAGIIPEEVETLADIGCGNGVFGNFIQRTAKGIAITGVDRSEKALSFVKTDKIAGDIISIPLDSNSFDCVSCLQVLEHIPNDKYRGALAELVRVSRKYILISVPYKEKIDKNISQCPCCKTIFNSDLHLRSYDDLTIENLFDEFGFACIQTENVVKGTKYFGTEILGGFKYLFSKSVLGFQSPICPLCGYENEHFTVNISPIASVIDQNGVDESKLENGSASAFRNAIKKIWPKRGTPGYWIIALYKKMNA